MKQRLGNFDLLKILSIYIIIIHHYALWSGWKFEAGFHLNKLTAETMLIGGKLGVNLFVMITGYFLIQSRAKIKSLLNVIIETTVFSIIMYLVTIGLHLTDHQFEWLAFLRKVFPVIFNEYWFVTAYTLMYLCVPAINKLMLTTSVEKIRKVLFFAFIILSLYTLIFFEKGVNFAHPIWFIYLYCIGGYIRLNQEKLKKIKLSRLILGLVTFFGMGIVLNIFLQITLTNTTSKLTTLLRSLGWFENIFYTRDASPLLLVMSILIFLIFLQFSIPSSKPLTYLANASFGVYLFQSAKIFSTSVLWPQIVQGAHYYSSKFILFRGILWALLIFIAGTILYTVLRPVIKVCQVFIGKLVDKIISKKRIVD